jgi:hypothetical protein
MEARHNLHRTRQQQEPRPSASSVAWAMKKGTVRSDLLCLPLFTEFSAAGPAESRVLRVDYATEGASDGEQRRPANIAELVLFGVWHSAFATVSYTQVLRKLLHRSTHFRMTRI